MLNVFADAGWHAHRSFADGTVRVRFSIEPTDDSIAAIQAREHQRRSARRPRALLAPRSIAVIGASRHAGTIGHELFRNLLAYDFQGPVYPVNPTSVSVAGVRAYPSILDVPDAVDVALVVVPAAPCPPSSSECAQKGVHGVVIISAGFAEVGTSGEEAERAIVATARRNGMRVIGPNCLGIVNTAPDVRMNATFAPVEPVRGPVAFLSQSGGLGIELMSRAGELGIGISEFVSVGNKADVSGNDLLQHWETDPNTSVILFYLESFGNPRKFARLARRIARRKAIVAVKSGRTQAGSRAASSHTAALATPDVAVDALFRQAGVIRVDTLEQLLDTAQVLAHQPLPPGRRVAIVGNAGGPGILAADACAGAGLEVPELLGRDASSVARVRRARRVRRQPGRPRRGGQRRSSTSARCGVVLADPGVDAVLVLFVPPLVTDADDVARAIAAAVAGARVEAGRRVLPRARGRARRAARRRRRRRTVPSFAFPEAAAHALGRAARTSPTGAAGPPATVPVFHRHRRGRAPTASWRNACARRRPTTTGRGCWLDATDVGARCSTASASRCSRPTLVSTAAEAAASAADALGYPVALKAGARRPRAQDRRRRGRARPRRRAPRSAPRSPAMEDRLGDGMGGAVVQRMAAPGVETIVGVTQDPSFGPLVLFGYGRRHRGAARGPYAATRADDRRRRPRARPLAAGSSPLLFGYRGQPAVDVAALEDLLLRVARLADEIPEVSEMDLNPVIVSSDGRGRGRRQDPPPTRRRRRASAADLRRLRV